MQVYTTDVHPMCFKYKKVATDRLVDGYVKYIHLLNTKMQEKEIKLHLFWENYCQTKGQSEQILHLAVSSPHVVHQQ